MLNYVVKRIAASAVTLFIVITATFFLMHALPGGPFDSEKPLPPQIKANLEEKYGLNKPVYQQYVLYLKNLSRGYLGPTLKYEGRSVMK